MSTISTTKNNNCSDKIALAPMDGITDLPFRLMVEKYSPKVNTVYTEFVNVQGLYEAQELHIKRLLFKPNEPHIIAQFFGNENQLKYFEIAAFIAKKMGFDGIDLNMGCPDKAIIKNCSGSALIGQEQATRKIITAIRKGLRSDGKEYLTDPKVKDLLEMVEPARNRGFLRAEKENLTVSIKTRLGINSVMPDSWWNFLDSLKLDFLAIHGRTQSQMYTGSANWKHIQRIKNLLKTPVLGNGDIENSHENKLRITPEGILIGRGFLGNVDMLSDNPPLRTLETQLGYIKEHITLYKNYISGDYIDPLKKHIIWYLKGLENVKSLKQKFMECQSYEDLLLLLENTVY